MKKIVVFSLLGIFCFVFVAGYIEKNDFVTVTSSFSDVAEFMPPSSPVKVAEFMPPSIVVSSSNGNLA